MGNKNASKRLERRAERNDWTAALIVDLLRVPAANGVVRYLIIMRSDYVIEFYKSAKANLILRHSATEHRQRQNKHNEISLLVDL